MILTLLSWSSGKDSAWSLHRLRQDRLHEVVGLLTTMNSAFDRVAIHSTQIEIVKAQAAVAGLPLHVVPLPWTCSNQEYEAAMHGACESAVSSGTKAMALGDLFLENVRRYREERLADIGLTRVFPVWGLNTGALVHEMLDARVKTRIVCVDPAKLPAAFAGRDLDAGFIRELPAGECTGTCITLWI